MKDHPMQTPKPVIASANHLVSRRCVLGTLAALGAAPAAMAQDAAFPSRAVTWVVPYAAGGFGDALSRVLAQKMSERFKQPVVVDNRPGAGGQIGANYVKQQPADGYTVLYGDIGPFALNASLYPKLSYDTLKDYTPLTTLFNSRLVVVVPASSPINSFADLIAAAKTPKGLNYGSYGAGSQPHVWTEMLKQRIQGNLTHIPYKGAAPALQDLIGGRLDMMCDVTPSSIPLVREGKLKALALVGSDKGIAQLPGIPSLTELGYPDLNLPGWNGVVVRAGTPAAVVARLHAEILAALQLPDVVQRYEALGLSLAVQSPQQFSQFIAEQTRQWGNTIQRAGITLE